MLKNILKQTFSLAKPVVLPDLKYDLNALEPVLSASMMEVHYKKHHQTYVNNTNAIYEQILDAQAKGDNNKLVQLYQLYSFNFGGHYNHSLYWDALSPTSRNGGQIPGSSSSLTQSVVNQYGSWDNLISTLKAKSIGVQGSGWGWLVFDVESQKLDIMTTGNQDMPAGSKFRHLLGIDVWEHAYYIDYQNLRPKYMENIWQIVDWTVVENRYKQAQN